MTDGDHERVGAAPAATPTPRRTQRERADAMVERLIRATIECIDELGYANTSIQAISDRAGVSRGALFAHFDSKEDLVLTVASVVIARVVHDFRQMWPQVSDDGDLAPVLRLMQEQTRSQDSMVWWELMMASRSDERLRAASAGLAQDNLDLILHEVSQIPGFDRIPPSVLPSVYLTLIGIFHSSALTHSLGGAGSRIDDQEIDRALAIVEAAISMD